MVNTDSLFPKEVDKTKLGRVVSIESPRSARVSVRRLQKMFNASRTRARKVEIIRAANRAANISKAQLNNPRISQKEKKEFRKVAKIYRTFVNKNKLTEEKTNNTIINRINEIL